MASGTVDLAKVWEGEELKLWKKLNQIKKRDRRVIASWESSRIVDKRYHDAIDFEP